MKENFFFHTVSMTPAPPSFIEKITITHCWEVGQDNPLPTYLTISLRVGVGGHLAGQALRSRPQKNYNKSQIYIY